MTCCAGSTPLCGAGAPISGPACPPSVPLSTLATMRGERCGDGYGANTAGAPGSNYAAGIATADGGQPGTQRSCSTRRRWARPATGIGDRSFPVPGPPPPDHAARGPCGEPGALKGARPGSGSGPEKRSGRKVGTALRANFHRPSTHADRRIYRSAPDDVRVDRFVSSLPSWVQIRPVYLLRGARAEAVRADVA